MTGAHLSTMVLTTATPPGTPPLLRKLHWATDPDGLQELYQESTNTPSGVHLESIRTSLKVAATVNPAKLHMYCT